MKKLFTAVLVLCMALSLAACSNNKAPANSNPGSGAGAGGAMPPLVHIPPRMSTASSSGAPVAGLTP